MKDKMSRYDSLEKKVSLEKEDQIRLITGCDDNGNEAARA